MSTSSTPVLYMLIAQNQNQGNTSFFPCFCAPRIQTMTFDKKKANHPNFDFGAVYTNTCLQFTPTPVYSLHQHLCDPFAKRLSITYKLN